MKTVFWFSAKESIIDGKVEIVYELYYDGVTPCLFANRNTGDLWPTLWAEVGLVDATDEPVTFAIRGTGHLVPDHWHHVASTTTPEGLVWHLYRTERSS